MSSSEITNRLPENGLALRRGGCPLPPCGAKLRKPLSCRSATERGRLSLRGSIAILLLLLLLLLFVLELV